MGGVGWSGIWGGERGGRARWRGLIMDRFNFRVPSKRRVNKLYAAFSFCLIKKSALALLLSGCVMSNAFLYAFLHGGGIDM